jgi:long-subunit fatty acid transport protein
MEIDPAMAFEIIPGLSVGGSLRIVRLSSGLKNQPFVVGSAVDMLKDLDVSGWGVGGSFGVLYKLSDVFSVGANWRSKVNPKLGGNAKFAALGNLPVSFHQPLPMLVSVGIGFKPIDELTLGVSYDFERNSEIDTLNVELTGLGTIPIPYNYTDSHTLHVGAELYVTEPLALRAGWARDFQASIPDTSMTRIVGDIAANEVSVGLAYTMKCVSLEGTWNARFGSRTVPVTTMNPGPGQYDAFVQMISLAAKISI